MPPIIRPPFSPIASSTQTRTAAQPGAGVTVISRDRRFTVTASKAPPVQEPHPHRAPGIEHLAQSLGLEPRLGATRKQPRVYTLQAASADDGAGHTHVPNPLAEP